MRPIGDNLCCAGIVTMLLALAVFYGRLPPSLASGSRSVSGKASRHARQFATRAVTLANPAAPQTVTCKAAAAFIPVADALVQPLLPSQIFLVRLITASRAMRAYKRNGRSPPPA